MLPGLFSYFHYIISANSILKMNDHYKFKALAIEKENIVLLCLSFETFYITF